MTDMLVKLYELPGLPVQTEARIRHPHAWERETVTGWVGRLFSPVWAREVGVAFGRTPVSAYIAVREGALAGFAAYDCTCRNFFGPMGVVQEARRQGIGRALLLAALHRMRDDGYAYAVIGGVGPEDFYRKTVGAEVIPGSTPGIYGQLLDPMG